MSRGNSKKIARGATIPGGGEWYLSLHDGYNRPSQSVLIPTHNVRRQSNRYIPGQSFFNYAERLGEGTLREQRTSFPRRDPGGRGGWNNLGTWDYRRFRGAPWYHTEPLGVTGLTDREDYSWNWYYNAYDNRTGRRFYMPPDREYGIPSMRKWEY